MQPLKRKGLPKCLASLCSVNLTFSTSTQPRSSVQFVDPATRSYNPSHSFSASCSCDRLSPSYHPSANINEFVAREIRFVRLATVMATVASFRQSPATWNWIATTTTTTNTTTTTKATTRSRPHLLVLLALLIIPSFLSAGTASAQCGADIGFPTEKLRVFAQDTINVTYTSTFDKPTLACWCGTSTDKDKSESLHFEEWLLPLFRSRRFTQMSPLPPGCKTASPPIFPIFQSPDSTLGSRRTKPCKAPRCPSRCPALWVTALSSTFDSNRPSFDKATQNQGD